MESVTIWTATTNTESGLDTGVFLTEQESYAFLIDWFQLAKEARDEALKLLAAKNFDSIVKLLVDLGYDGFHVKEHVVTKDEPTSTGSTPGPLRSALGRIQAVDAFADLMTRELVANAHKGDFLSWHPSAEECMSELHHHLEKLSAALRVGEAQLVSEHTADVANICMKTNEMFGLADIRSSRSRQD